MEKIYTFIDEYVSENNELGQRLARFGDEKHIWIKFETEKHLNMFRVFLQETSKLFTNYQKFDPIVLTGNIIDEDDSNIFINVTNWEIENFTNINKPLLQEKDFNKIVENMEKWLTFVEMEQNVILIGERNILSKHKYENFKNVSIYHMQGIFSLWRLNIRLRYPLKGDKKYNITFIK